MSKEEKEIMGIQKKSEGEGRKIVGIFVENGCYISKMQQEDFIMKQGALTHERAKSARALPN